MTVLLDYIPKEPLPYFVMLETCEHNFFHLCSFKLKIKSIIFEKPIKTYFSAKSSKSFIICFPKPSPL
jgi:hypothetical protein